MNIPARIIKLGASKIEEYAKLALQKEEVGSELRETENKIEETLTAINDQIGRFLPNGRTQGSDSFVYESKNFRHLVPSLNGHNPINNIYTTEELLKEIRELVLDSRTLELKMELLTMKMKEF